MTDEKPYPELDEGDWHQFRAGSHFVQAWVEDGQLKMNIRDHAQMTVEGEHKENPTVVIGGNEFPTEFLRLSEEGYWDRYHD